MVMRIYTKTGDRGQTSLFGGQRVYKDDLRVEAYGAVDELNASLGLARVIAARTHDGIDTLIGEVQSLLFDLGGQLATPPEREARVHITDSDIQHLERAIDTAELELQPLKSFILPGGTLLSAHLHMARCVCRRAERRCVALMRHEGGVPEQAVVFLNRLSDLLFVLARLANHYAGVADVPWTASR